MYTGDEQYLDVAAVRAEARLAWESRTRKSLSVQERIGESVPWWLVLIAAVFFLLSLPHTVAIFNKITPFVGYVSPLGIEFGLLYAAFRRRQVRQRSLQLWVLEALLFFTAIIVNGAGSFEAVVASTRDIQGMSFEDLLAQYRDLPATSQVAILLAPVAALIIPIGTVVAGEGLAMLMLERREHGNMLEERWAIEGPRIEFEALRDAAIAQGVTPGRAVRWAEQIIGFSRDILSAPSAVSAPERTDNADAPDISGRPLTAGGQGQRTGAHGSGQGYSKNMSAREIMWQYLEDNPDAVELSVRDLAAAAGIGKTVAAEVRNEFLDRRFSSNGHGQRHD